MPRSTAWWIPALLCAMALAPARDAAAAPVGTVELRDGRKWEGVEYEIKGDRLHVKFPNNRGAIDVPMADVKTMRADPTAGRPGGEEGEDEGGGDAQQSSVDWEGRFRLEPPPGWVAAAPGSPLMRAQVRHGERNAGLAVFIRQVSGPGWTPEAGAVRQVPREVTEEVGQDLAARYARVQGTRVDVGTLFEAPVLRVEGQVQEHGDTLMKKLVELRFRRLGLDYSLAYTVAPPDEGALAGELPRLLEAFSFLPVVVHTDAEYWDYGRGFWISRASAEWQLQAAPFDEEQPARLLIDGGRAELGVQLHPGTDAEGVLRGIMNKRKEQSRYFEASRVESADHHGSTVRRFQFEDFNPGGRKKLLFRGFAAALGGKVVVFTGVHPLSDDDARKLDGELAAMLDGVRLWDAERIRRQLADAQNAIALISQGMTASAAKRHDEALQRFDQALQLCPSYARAVYLRALVKRDMNDFKGFREDIERAAALDPNGNYDAALAASYVKEAELAERAKNYPEALKLRVRVYRSERTDANLRALTTCANFIWNEAKKDMRQIERHIRTLETELRPVIQDPGVSNYLAGVYRDAAQGFQRESNFRKAKQWANRAKAVAVDPRIKQEAERLVDQIQQAEDRARGR
ncbi:MAG: hypothetical protein KF878_38055 [Planctomycetes bacterium]|nr:hypothetical protein [Planctomycetota bacterium]